MRVLKIIGLSLAALVATYFLVAVGAVLWPAEIFVDQAIPTTAQFALLQRASGIRTDQVYPHREQRFVARDGVQLFARVFGQPAKRTIVLLHGVASDSSAMSDSAGRIHAETGAQVIALDLRGHGHSGGEPWQVSYAGQYDDDVADVIKRLRAAQPDGKIILAGHSMGGGIALRYALNPTAPAPDGYLLFAPLLGGDSPSGRAAAPVTAAQGRFVYFRTARLVGALLLNLVGVHSFDTLPILYFNQPRAPAYGLAALQSMQPNAPRDYRCALRAIKVPLLVVVGSKDEAFNASAYPDVLRVNGHADSTKIIDGSTHNRVLSDPRTITIVSQWISKV
jgi:alpha-beta hydrolase superfamily lysophospholipase